VYSAIEHIARICSLSCWKDVLMAMLTTAFDCSQDKQRKYFVMAGFVSSAAEWSEFDKEWRERLAIENLPYFHMNRFAHSLAPFDATWRKNETRRRALLSDLLDMIAHRAWRKFGCIIPLDSFRLFSDESKRHFVPSLIATAGRLIWPELEIWRRREGYREPARLVFEDGDAEKGTLIEAIKHVTGRSPSFESKKDIPEKSIVGFTPLQAADILAYEIQKVTQAEGFRFDEKPFRFPYQQLEKTQGDIRMLRASTRILLVEPRIELEDSLRFPRCWRALSFSVNARHFLPSELIPCQSLADEPSGFLGDTDGPVNFIRVDLVLAVHNLPHRDKPFVQPSLAGNPQK
jgi:hypothetical protein